jgi:hypothetical protein
MLKTNMQKEDWNETIIHTIQVMQICKLPVGEQLVSIGDVSYAWSIYPDLTTATLLPQRISVTGPQRSPQSNHSHLTPNCL